MHEPIGYSKPPARPRWCGTSVPQHGAPDRGQPAGPVPIDMALNFLNLCHAQTCGKCVPCRIGLGQLATLIESVMNRTATLETIDRIERTAKVIADSADCAIGYEAAVMVLKGVKGFRDDYEEHILRGRCITGLTHPVPCVSVCPAHVDVPGYIALIREKRYDELSPSFVRTIPFPVSAAMSANTPVKSTAGAAWLTMPSISAG